MGLPDGTVHGAPVGRRSHSNLPRLLLAVGFGIAAVVAFASLNLGFADLLPDRGGWRLAGEFFSRVWQPALSYESRDVPEGATPLLLQALGAVWRTVAFAAAALLPAVVLGLLLGFGAAGAGARGGTVLRRAIAVGCRVSAAGLRSIHELMWAVLLLAALGISPLAALLALALPYAGVFGKVFAEMIAESPQDSAVALRESGASPAQAFLFGLLPRALPDMLAYLLYRFECGLRSAAVLGFFGFPTLGYYIAASFENLHYGEVWTYLHVLVLLVIVVEWWSGAVRRRLVG